MSAPDPLTPHDCDLRGYEFMPLYGHHLFGSDFNARVSDAGWRAAVTLWWAAWNQVPAASLPNDDIALTRLADLGRDVKSFRRIKTEAMHGFLLCSDGRLYHRKLSQWALVAWDRRVKEREKKATYRAQRGSEAQYLKLRREILERDGYRCLKCSSTDDLHCDHIVPLSKGGKTARENLQTLCGKCNASKQAKTQDHRQDGEQDGNQDRTQDSGQAITQDIEQDRTAERTGEDRRGQDSEVNSNFVKPEVATDLPLGAVDNSEKATSGPKKLKGKVNGEHRSVQSRWKTNDAMAQEAGAHFGVTRRENESLPDFVDRIEHARKHQPARRSS